ncbi:acetyl-coenzyme A carboxylase carboxyl transferase subunit alpha [Rhodospirillales bacterium TMPK1]|uniref:Acetyl-coenzyme A carboxylase carboxyl transferase subunit alpha n=1 Tax=Roseiterribacter gracilis TaxID=2812848 RepID=A0A8S8X899_9PROT|nr:acetyl-coenzyme A carboxylase carboxyl transferase subunit alpha [Rhodospirillales bacterium TMPK1]
MVQTLEFEKPILELESKIEELRHMTSSGGVDVADEVSKLQGKVDRLLKTTYAKLTPAQKVQVARHPERPHTLDYVERLFTEFTPLAGDRRFGEDAAMISGLARFRGRACVVLGQERGHDTETRLRHNFGMVKPEGYRKAERLMLMAERFHLPVVTLVDTAGAFPGIQAEERGQSEAIAKCIETCLKVKVPIVAVVIGEGGSGGAIAIAAADRVLMLEHAIYSVISPEGCASILWRSAAQSGEAAAALRLTAQDLKEFKVIDGIVGEPYGGAHRRREETIDLVGDAIESALHELRGLDGAALLARRRQKFLDIGQSLQ